MLIPMLAEKDTKKIKKTDQFEWGCIGKCG